MIRSTAKKHTFESDIWNETSLWRVLCFPQSRNTKLDVFMTNQVAAPLNLEDTAVDDDTTRDTTTAPVQYDITSFGADYDVEGLIKRLRRGDIFIPPFQRDYVWNQAEASRLIESLLLGLPVPGIFLARESETNKLLVLDGQQRLKTLLFFYEGFFNPKPADKSRRVFKLTKVQPQFEGLTYDTLNEKDRIKLDDSIIHATIVKQETPEDGDTSIYHIFERLNNGGRKLTAQEIRVAIYHGNFIDLIKELNDNEDWRAVFGKKNARLKDQELILRFLAMFFSSDDYERPMREFLNKFADRHKISTPRFLNECKQVFGDTIKYVRLSIGDKAFRPERALNAAVFDSVMFGLSKRLQRQPEPNLSAFKEAYDKLLSDEVYLESVSRSTSDENNVSRRLEIASKQFSNL